MDVEDFVGGAFIVAAFAALVALFLRLFGVVTGENPFPIL